MLHSGEIIKLAKVFTEFSEVSCPISIATDAFHCLEYNKEDVQEKTHSQMITYQCYQAEQ